MENNQTRKSRSEMLRHFFVSGLYGLRQKTNKNACVLPISDSFQKDVTYCIQYKRAAPGTALI